MTEKGKLNPQYFLSILLSAGLSIITSVVYIVLCIIILILRSSCSSGQLRDKDGSQYFWTTVYRVYIQKSDCNNTLEYSDLTQAHTVCVMTIIILAFAVFHICSAIALITVAYKENAGEIINIYTCVYIGSYISVFIVDLTLGIHFGIDISTMKREMDLSSPGFPINYEKDMLRLGALIFMTITLKGFIVHAINMVMVVLLGVYTVRQYQSNQNKHPIHNLGVLNAFEQPKQMVDPWPVQNNDMFFLQRSISNTHDEPPRMHTRDNTLSDISNSHSYDRSNSWHHNQAGTGLGSRPFSYLEEPKRPVPIKPPVPPVKPEPTHPNWRRDPWPQGPHVPDPDYSPPARRLKSALKNRYP